MTGTTNASTKTAVIATPAERAVVVALRKLPPLYVSDVLRYIEFLDYKINVTSDELAGDAALWAAVKVNQEYHLNNSGTASLNSRTPPGVVPQRVGGSGQPGWAGCWSGPRDRGCSDRS